MQKKNGLMIMVSDNIPGYTYGSAAVATSPVSMDELADLKNTVGFSPEDERYLQLAGTVLSGQTAEIVQHWRVRIIGSIPHLARHTRALDGQLIPLYSRNSGLRFEQWILDTCQRPYNQDWLNYQQEIASRHTTLKKNKVDNVQSTPFVPLRDYIAFIAVINQTIQPYLAAKGNSPEEIEGMHRAWCKSLQLQMALWSRPYTDVGQSPNEW